MTHDRTLHRAAGLAAALFLAAAIVSPLAAGFARGGGGGPCGVAPSSSTDAPSSRDRIDDQAAGAVEIDAVREHRLTVRFADVVTSSPTPVPAPTSVDDAVGLIPTIAKDLAEGGPGTLLAVGLILMIVILVLNKTGVLAAIGIPPAWSPYVAILLGVLGGVASALATGKALLPAIGTGVLVGLASVGKWEALGSKVVGSPGPAGGA